MAAAMLAVLAVAGGPAAMAQPDAITTIRAGNHPGFGRIVIDADARTAYQVDQAGDRVVVRFLSPVTLGRPPAPPRNVVAIRTGDQTIELTIRSGSTIRPGRIGDRFVIDVMGPATHRLPGRRVTTTVDPRQGKRRSIQPYSRP